MNYILLIYADEAEAANWTEADWAACYAGHQAYSEAMEAAGVLRGGAELKPVATARTVRFATGKPGRPIDGPFAETRENLGGYYVIETETLEEAVTWAEKMPCMQGGGVEVRELGMGG
jgi:hypothetical protein